MLDLPEYVSWGQPGSFLLPRALRRLLGNRSVPSNVRAFMPSVSQAEPIHTARFPLEWTLVPAVARSLVEFIRAEGLLDIGLVPVPVPSDDGGRTVEDVSNCLRSLARPVGGSPVLRRLLGSTENDDVVAVLERATLRDLLRAARNDAEAFLAAAMAVDVAMARPGVDHEGSTQGAAVQLATSAVHSLPGAEQDRSMGGPSEPDGWTVPPVGEQAIAVGHASHRADSPNDKTLHRKPLLTGTQRGMLSAMSGEEWAGFLATQPRRLKNQLLRHCGGEEEVRRFLTDAEESDLGDIRNMGAHSRAQVGLLLEALPYSKAAPSAFPGTPDSRPSNTVDATFERLDLPPCPDGAELVCGDDPRFRDLLEAGDDMRSALSRLSLRDGRSLLDRVADRQATLSAETIEDEGLTFVTAALGVVVDHPRGVALGARFGLSGQEPSTTADVAQVLGVSRSRVGQFSQRISAQVPTKPVWAPLVEQMVQTVHSVVPCAIGDLNEALQGADLTAITWTAPALVAIAGLTGRQLDLQYQDGFAVSTDDVGLVRSVLATARRVSDRNGAAAVDQVLSEIDHKDGATEALVRDVLTGRSDVTWLSRDWFWTRYGNMRNRLVNTSQRILVVHQPQHLSSLIEGVSRNYSWRNSSGRVAQGAELQVPPPEILSEFYAHHPTFTMNAGLISSVDPIDIDSLGPEKLTLVGLLRAQPWPVMSRSDLIEACRAEGMNTGTASIFLTYAECIENFGWNVWGLRGTKVPADVIDDLQRSARERSRNFDREFHEGVTEGGRPWFAQRLAPGALHSGVIVTRWSSNLEEDDRLAVIDGTDGERSGTLRRSGNFIYGLSNLIRRNRPDVGDYIRLVLYRQDGYAVADVGGQELTECPYDWS